MTGDYLARRKRLGLSRQQLADEAGISARVLERIERMPETVKLTEHEALTETLGRLEALAHDALIAGMKKGKKAAS